MFFKNFTREIWVSAFIILGTVFKPDNKMLKPWGLHHGKSCGDTAYTYYEQDTQTYPNTVLAHDRQCINI